MTGPHDIAGPFTDPVQYGGSGFRPAPRNGLGTAALVLAILGLVTCWSVLGGIAFGLAAVILGFLGRGRAARGEADNGQIATAGTALGAVAIAASVAFVVIWSFAWRDSGGSEYLDCAVRAGNDRQAVDRCTQQWLDEMGKQLDVSTASPGST